MVNLMDNFGSDPELEENGVPVEIQKDLTVTLCALYNDKFTAFLEKLKKPHLTAIRNKTLSADKENDLYVRAMAKYVLVGWSGTIDHPDTGEALEYSYENAYIILSHKKLKSFKALIFKLAAERETFVRQETEDAEKNLSKSSTGKSDGTMKEKK